MSMALKIDTSDLDEKFKRLLEMPQLIEKAVVGAVSETVNDMYDAAVKEMRLVFDRPTPWLERGIIKALPYGKDRQVGGRRLGQSISDSGLYFEEFGKGLSQNDVIRPHVYGGARKKKPNEKGLASVGAFTSNGQYAIMARGYPKDKHGNIPGSVYSRMLADLGAIPTARAGKKREGKPAKFFVMRNESGQEYIAERVGDDLRPVLIFVDSVNYKKRYDFHRVGKTQIAVSLPLHFNRILNRYLGRL